MKRGSTADFVLTKILHIYLTAIGYWLIAGSWIGEIEWFIHS